MSRHTHEKALADMKRMLVIIVFAAVAMVVGSLWYLSLYAPLRHHMVVATIAGVFVSVLLGCGLFAAAFFSDKSGHDQKVTDASQGKGDEDDARS